MQILTLTTGVDNFVGTDGNDTFNATNTPTSTVLGGLDKIDGGKGTNTLNIADTTAGVVATPVFTLPTGISISNIQVENITTNGALGTGAAAFDLSGQAGLTTATLIAADAQATNVANVKVADTTALNLTVTAGDVTTVVGGKAVTVNNGAAVTVGGAALTSVTANKAAGLVTVSNDTVTGTTDGKGTTLTSVTLNGTAAGASLTGNGLTNVTVQNLTAAQTVTVNNATVGGHTLNVTASGVGYTAAGVGGTANATTIADANATALTLAATGRDNVILTAGNAKALTVTGAGAVTIDATSTFGTLKTIDLSGNSGGVTMTDGAAGAVLTGGAGNDVVTLAAALTKAAGGSINLGAGNNVLLGGGGSIGAGVSVNGGVGGTNTISASLVNAGNAAGITNFQTLDISGFGATAGNGAFDTSLMGSAVSGVSISTAKTAGLATLQNLGANVTITDTFDAAAANASSLTLTHAGTATNNTLTVNFASTAKTTTNVETISALTSTGDASVTISSGGVSTGVGFGNAITALAETDNNLANVTITGAKAFTLGGVTTAVTNTTLPTAGFTASSLTKIDGSTATGALNITAGADSGAGNNVVKYTGLTILGGTGGDTIANAAKGGFIIEGATAATKVNTLTVTGIGATVNDAASAGADIINLSAKGGTAILGSGTGVTVNVANVAATVGNTATITLGTGTAKIVDSLLYQDTASAVSSATDGNLVLLNGTLKGNSIDFGTVANNTTLGAATSVAGAQTFDQAVFLAENATANTVTWFQFGGNTYVESSGAAGGTADNIVVKIVGTVDLSGALASAAAHTVTFA
ncbi:hypothetical protein BJN34_21225 [Cupriavidus necator]|uniref:S-layer protein n=1 Tax=Cupriavidus necator TaxID=106590 RepID=A0A1U9UUP3_CUPNE|nr:hypothetical protein [Cupriavidus necator]AQV96393.1 hypothetical protein BJN34_21225 [Cupriavidus necator]